jgi:hypothetical protein
MKMQTKVLCKEGYTNMTFVFKRCIRKREDYVIHSALLWSRSIPEDK